MYWGVTHIIIASHIAFGYSQNSQISQIYSLCFVHFIQTRLQTPPCRSSPSPAKAPHTYAAPAHAP